MAHPIDFAEANLRLLPPEGQEDSVIAMSAFRDGGVIISCWRLSAEDLRRIAETGEIWLSIAGHTAPPVLVTGLKEDVIA
jgi:hypothetical protein